MGIRRDRSGQSQLRGQQNFGFSVAFRWRFGTHQEVDVQGRTAQVEEQNQAESVELLLNASEAIDDGRQEGQEAQ